VGSVDVGRRCPCTRADGIGLRPVAHHRRARSRCGATGGPCRGMGAGRGTVDARPPSAPVAHRLVKRAARRATPQPAELHLFRADAAPSWRRSAAARAGHPGLARPDRRRAAPGICAGARTPAAPPVTPVGRSACRADDTRRCPELVSRCCNRRRAARAARRTHDRERAFVVRADAWLPRPRTAGADLSTNDATPIRDRLQTPKRRVHC
jgi:hypothetical protein